MNKKIDIGASISSRKDASSDVENVFSAEDFPCTLTIKNHSTTRLILPELKALDLSALDEREVTFNDLGLLKRVTSSLAQISRLGNYSKLATISLAGVVDLQIQAETIQAETVITHHSDEEITATLIEELAAGALLVAVGDIQFEIKKGQLRENGTLTAGGITAYEAKKASLN